MPYTGQHASPGWNTPAQDPKPAAEYSGTAAPTQMFGSGQAASGGSYQSPQSPQAPYTPQSPPAQQSAPTPQYGSSQGSAQSAYGGAPTAAPPPVNYGPPQQPPAQQQPSYGAQAGYPQAPAQPAYGGPPPSRPSYQPGPYGGAPQGYPGQQGGPPAGPQGYGPGYPSAPPKKSRTALFLTLGAVVLLAIVAVVLFLTLSKTVLDPAAVQRDVAAQFQDQEGVGIQLTCPTDMEVEVGATYECTGTTEDSEDVTLVIEVSDEDGNYTWQERQ